MSQDPEDNKIAQEAGGGSEERRLSQRLPLEAVVHYQVEGSEFINLSSNISSAGIFIKNFAPPPVGTEIQIKVELPDKMSGAPLQLLGKVVRVADGVGSAHRGMGVEFTAVLADSPDAIRYFVSQVYEMTQLERLEKAEDGETSYRYTPGPEDVLRIRNDQPSGQTAPEPLGRSWLPGVLLLLVGLLLGAGLVLLIMQGLD